MIGKDKENEFLLILLFMGVCKSVSGFDEGVSKIFTSATSDLIIELKSGQKFLLEIKHTNNERYEISSGNLSKRISYAKSFGLDLYFAISIKGYWMLFNSDYLKKKNGKIDVGDIMHSDLDKMLATCSYLFPNGLSIRSVYKISHPKALGIKHHEYGDLVSYELRYKEQKIFRVKGQNSHNLGLSMILEALEDRMSVVSQKIEKDGDITVITESFPDRPENESTFNAISEYEFLLSPVKHTISENGTNYTASSAIETLKSDKTVSRFQPDHIRGLMSTLVSKGIPIRCVSNGIIYEIPDASQK